MLSLTKVQLLNQAKYIIDGSGVVALMFILSSTWSPGQMIWGTPLTTFFANNFDVFRLLSHAYLCLNYYVDSILCVFINCTDV